MVTKWRKAERDTCNREMTNDKKEERKKKYGILRRAGNSNSIKW